MIVEDAAHELQEQEAPVFFSQAVQVVQCLHEVICVLFNHVDEDGPRWALFVRVMLCKLSKKLP